MNGSGPRDDTGARRRAPNQVTRRTWILAATGAISLAAAAGAGWWTTIRRREGLDAPAGTGAPEARRLPGTMPTELAVRGELLMDAEDLGAAFRSVSVQDIAPMSVTDGIERLLVTQRGADRQIQFVAVDGSADPLPFDSPFGVNPGVAVAQEGTSYFVTREEGHVLTVDGGLSALRDLGRVDEQATSLYSPVIGSDGTVYGGSYPTGAVWSLDPETGVFRIGPRIAGNQYVRSLAVVRGRLYAGTGGIAPLLVEIDPVDLTATTEHSVPGAREGGSISRLTPLPDGGLLVYRDEADGGSDGILFDPVLGEFGEELAPGASSRSLAPEAGTDALVYVAAGSIMRWVPGSEPETLGPSPLENPAAVVRIRDGTVIAVAADAGGRSMLQVAPVTPAGRVSEVAVLPSGHDLTAVIPMSSSGRLAIGGYQADGVVLLDPGTGRSTRTRPGSGIQQVEGGIEATTGSVVVGSYGEGRVHEVSHAGGGDDPVVVQVDDLGDEFQQARPIAWGRLDEGRLAVGTVPEQGRHGGIVQTFRRAGGRLQADSVVRDPADGLSVVGVLGGAPGDAILTTSVRGGYGVPPDATVSRVLRVALEDGDVLWETEVPVPDSYSPIVQQGRIFCATTSGVIVLDLEDGRLLARIDIGPAADTAGYASARIEPWEVEGRFLHSARGRLSVIDLVEGTVSTGPEPIGARVAVLGGRLYAASGPSLVRVTLTEPE